MQGDPILKTLFRKAYIETVDLQYVFDCDASAHLILQTSNHNLCNGTHMVFLQYGSSDELSDGLIWYKFYCNRHMDMNV